MAAETTVSSTATTTTTTTATKELDFEQVFNEVSAAAAEKEALTTTPTSSSSEFGTRTRPAIYVGLPRGLAPKERKPTVAADTGIAIGEDGQIKVSGSMVRQLGATLEEGIEQAAELTATAQLQQLMNLAKATVGSATVASSSTAATSVPLVTTTAVTTTTTTATISTTAIATATDMAGTARATTTTSTTATTTATATDIKTDMAGTARAATSTTTAAADPIAAELVKQLQATARAQRRKARKPADKKQFEDLTRQLGDMHVAKSKEEMLVCGEPTCGRSPQTMIRCGTCHGIVYCTTQCQRKHAAQHRKVCSTERFTEELKNVDREFEKFDAKFPLFLPMLRICAARRHRLIAKNLRKHRTKNIKPMAVVVDNRVADAAIDEPKYYLVFAEGLAGRIHNAMVFNKIRESYNNKTLVVIMQVGTADRIAIKEFSIVTELNRTDDGKEEEATAAAATTIPADEDPDER